MFEIGVQRRVLGKVIPVFQVEVSPWLDASTFKLKNYRDKLYRYAIKSKLLEDWNKYKEIRNKYNIFIKCKMKNYFFGKNSSFFKEILAIL